MLKKEKRINRVSLFGVMKKVLMKGGKKIMLTKKGFSLVEVLVALLVLSVGIIAISALMTGSIKSSQNSKNQIVASQLAQEGIELVRNFKDNENLLVDGSDYRADKNTIFSGFANSAASDKKLYLKAGFFVHDSTGSTATKFLRKISIATDPNGKAVTSMVSWNSVGFQSPCNVSNKCISIVSVLP